uniref:Uncharacterized protein n=1 Tax=Tetranychus urticae TaxID=32264 RepID=T1KBU6_TETUR
MGKFRFSVITRQQSFPLYLFNCWVHQVNNNQVHCAFQQVIPS